MLRLRSAFVFILALTCAAPALADLRGRIEVLDGDTIRVAGEKIRLHGIDTPESDQRCGGHGTPMWACGDWVTREVRARFQGKTATCQGIERDRYGRLVAKCDVAGQDMGAALVSDGLAFAYRKYSMDYDLDEKQAAIRNVGLHGQGVLPPHLYRSGNRAGQAQATMASAPDGCVIKGNISNNGRIFHVPGQEWHDRTRISPQKGERWFCSEPEARAAGWRKARR